MFGFGLKAKVKRVIREEFFYEVSYMYEPLFNNLYQQGKMLGQNEYSIAIYYMTVMMNVLVDNQKEYPGDLQVVDQFIKKHTSNINRIIHQANSPEADIRNLVNEVNNNFALVKKKSLQKIENTLHNEADSENESKDSTSPFALEDDDRAWLLREMRPLIMTIRASKRTLFLEINKQKNNISETEISYIRCFQLFGALDYSAQEKNWSPERTLEPFFALAQEEPFNLDMTNIGKIIGFMSNERNLKNFPEIIELQINGAKINNKASRYPLRISGEGPFSDSMIEIGNENALEVSKLTSDKLLITLGNL